MRMGYTWQVQYGYGMRLCTALAYSVDGCGYTLQMRYGCDMSFCTMLAYTIDGCGLYMANVIQVWHEFVHNACIYC